MTETAKGLSQTEMKLLTDFSNVVTARQLNQKVDISELTMSFKKDVGFTIALTETPIVTSETTTA